MAKLISFRNFGEVLDNNNACCPQIFPVGQNGIEKIEWGKSRIDLFFFLTLLVDHDISKDVDFSH